METKEVLEKALTREFLLDLKREIYFNSYYEFFKFAFRILMPTQEYVDAPHIKYLCDVLQKEVERILQRKEKTKDIIINIPPRTSKSLIVSVAFNAWVWIRMPEATFICSSFDIKLALKNGADCRNIIASPEYQELFGDIFKIDEDSKGYYTTDKGGYRISTSSGSNVTGFSGLFLVCLPEGQKIITSKGELDIKQIVEEKEDVEILSYNHETGKNEYKKIKRYDKNPGRKLIKIKTKTKEMICTEEHEIWTENRGYVMARDLTVDDILRVEE